MVALFGDYQLNGLSYELLGILLRLILVIESRSQLQHEFALVEIYVLLYK